MLKPYLDVLMALAQAGYDTNMGTNNSHNIQTNIV